MFHSRGFTLIEVLISMVILAIGLLGLAAMQGISLRDNLDSYNYQQATILAYEMQDRIRGNSGTNWQSIAGTAAPSYNASKCISLETACNADDMAANDYGYWQENVKNTLPKLKDGSDATAKIEDSNNQGGGCKNTYDTSVCLVTTWGRANSKDSNKASKLSETAKFYLEVTP